MAEALQFLQERGGACHNNVSMSSVFVSPEGARWRLGGMEFVKRFQEESQAFLDQCRPMRCPNSIPPEEKAGGNMTKAPSSSSARDVYAFGRLAEQVILEGKKHQGRLIRVLFHV